jgi:hypothetical protein
VIVRVDENDERNEQRVAELIERAWGVQMRKFGRFDRLDRFGVENGVTRFVAEIKVRRNESNRYPTVFASAAKWFYLLRFGEALGVPGLYVFAFTDGVVGYVKADEIDARRNRIAGRIDRVDAPNDQELIIDVPIEQLHRIEAPVEIAEAA